MSGPRRPSHGGSGADPRWPLHRPPLRPARGARSRAEGCARLVQPVPVPVHEGSGRRCGPAEHRRFHLRDLGRVGRAGDGGGAVRGHPRGHPNLQQGQPWAAAPLGAEVVSLRQGQGHRRAEARQGVRCRARDGPRVRRRHDLQLSHGQRGRRYDRGRALRRGGPGAAAGAVLQHRQGLDRRRLRQRALEASSVEGEPNAAE
mmetsp:Transcript_111445/g.322215  ORF Transcript_111445/g.322215 Transcript_111445/m.322215 type:complete len:202 (+) Transcript_111445:220-825(+)